MDAFDGVIKIERAFLSRYFMSLSFGWIPKKGSLFLTVASFTI